MTTICSSASAAAAVAARQMASLVGPSPSVLKASFEGVYRVFVSLSFASIRNNAPIGQDLSRQYGPSLPLSKLFKWGRVWSAILFKARYAIVIRMQWGAIVRIASRNMPVPPKTPVGGIAAAIKSIEATQ